MEPSTVTVYSSYAYAVEPRSFTVGTTRHRVREITRRWRTEKHLHWYVRADNEQLYELRYDEPGDTWAVRAFGETCPPRSLLTSSDLMP